MIAAKNVITPYEANKEELTFEESCVLDKEHICKKEIKEDEEVILGDQNKEVNQAYESFVEQRFQVSTRFVQSFHFYFNKLHFLHQLILHIFVHVRFHFANSNMNLCLLLLQEWLHWQFHYT